MNINKLIATGLFVSASVFAVQVAAVAQDQAASAEPADATNAAANAATDNASNATNEAAPAANPQIVAFVDYQFPKADTDGDGVLSADEFKTWMSGLKRTEFEKAGKPVDEAAVKTYADTALVAADKDKDGMVSKAELLKLFGG